MLQILFVYVIVFEMVSRWEMSQSTEAVNEMYLPHTHVPLTDSSVHESSCAAFGQDEEECEAAGCVILTAADKSVLGCTAAKRLEPQDFFPVFVNFYSASADSCFAFTMLGINSIITWLKLLKYLNAFPHLAMMTKTVGNALAPSFSFMVMFFIFFIGCAQAFTLVFGGNLVRSPSQLVAHTASLKSVSRYIYLALLDGLTTRAAAAVGCGRRASKTSAHRCCRFSAR